MRKNNFKSMNKPFKTRSHILYPRLTQNGKAQASRLRNNTSLCKELLSLFSASILLPKLVHHKIFCQNIPKGGGQYALPLSIPGRSNNSMQADYFLKDCILYTQFIQIQHSIL